MKAFPAITVDNPPHIAKRSYSIITDFEYEQVKPIAGKERDVLTSIHLKTEEGYKVQHVAGDRFYVSDPNVSGLVQVTSPDLFNAIFGVEPARP